MRSTAREVFKFAGWSWPKRDRATAVGKCGAALHCSRGCVECGLALCPSRYCSSCRLVSKSSVHSADDATAAR